MRDLQLVIVAVPDQFAEDARQNDAAVRGCAGMFFGVAVNQETVPPEHLVFCERFETKYVWAVVFGVDRGLNVIETLGDRPDIRHSLESRIVFAGSES